MQNSSVQLKLALPYRLRQKEFEEYITATQFILFSLQHCLQNKHGRARCLLTNNCIWVAKRISPSPSFCQLPLDLRAEPDAPDMYIRIS